MLMFKKRIISITQNMLLDRQNNFISCEGAAQPLHLSCVCPSVVKTEFLPVYIPLHPLMPLYTPFYLFTSFYMLIHAL